jgi:hypothetical protein
MIYFANIAVATISVATQIALATAPGPQSVSPAAPTTLSADSDVQQNQRTRDNSAQAVVRDGTFMPLTTSARIGDQYGSAFVLGGYDTTKDTGATTHAVVEGSIINRVAVRVVMDYRSALEKPTLGAGLRFGVLRQEDHGLNLGVVGAYKNRGFSEKAGEVEAGLMASRRWNNILVGANATYGQGVFEQERDSEVSLGGLYSLSRMVHVGLDARARFDLGEEDGEGESGAEAEREGKGAAGDVVVGPVAALTLGPAAIFVQVAGHAIVTESPTGEQTNGGLLTMAGVAIAY